MAHYLLIQSSDPFANAVEPFYAVAESLAKAGNEVTLFLVQDGVLPARPSARSEDLARLARARVMVLAEHFSLRERGIDVRALTTGVHATPLETVIDLMEKGCKTFWN
jgi:sulfur relay (sulfurtransferase) complex TusBCD TusD component (DsrE family)